MGFCTDYEKASRIAGGMIGRVVTSIKQEDDESDGRPPPPGRKPWINQCLRAYLYTVGTLSILTVPFTIVVYALSLEGRIAEALA